ncbi:hypothetical protein MOO45_01960 [Bombilactobacillus folatiphilus]|uniref:Uncharacterized protein n=1 Tax=Bombilactobacillus folatiphilus TaxID=2923362 RepID=A0ABY4P9Q3_9LACO|nr:hypothetical protein [Bombilactobacillus folatiphilus]UQS82473.1 hypothetical protein MOO45_01960 [Bombilactobacillus folatiphilus]
MQIIDLYHYYTPKQRTQQCVEQQQLASSGFYDAIFHQKLAQLQKRLFILTQDQRPIALLNSLVPTQYLPENDQSVADLEAIVDAQEQVVQIGHDIMLTWANDDEKKWLQFSPAQAQILLRQSTFLNAQKQVIRYEEEAMLPAEFMFQKGTR